MFEAGWAFSDSDYKVTKSVAIGFVTWKVADSCGLKNLGRIEVGEEAKFLGYENCPLEFGRISGIFDGFGVTRWPNQK